jgi:uncharacterized repeat protein (TIGR04076 family)
MFLGGYFVGESYRLVITAKEIRGKCSVFKLGDKIVIEKPKIILKETDALCAHAFGSMTSMITALSKGVSFKELGLAKKEGNVGYVQCLDPGTPYTDGGTVIFEIKREKLR